MNIFFTIIFFIAGIILLYKLLVEVFGVKFHVQSSNKLDSADNLSVNQNETSEDDSEQITISIEHSTCQHEKQVQYSFQEIKNILDIAFSKLNDYLIDPKIFFDFDFLFPEYSIEYFKGIYSNYLTNDLSISDKEPLAINLAIDCIQYLQANDMNKREDIISDMVRSLIHYDERSNHSAINKRYYPYIQNIPSNDSSFSIINRQNPSRGIWFFNGVDMYKYPASDVEKFFNESNLGYLRNLDFSEEFANYSKKHGSFMNSFLRSIIRAQLIEILAANGFDGKNLIKEKPELFAEMVSQITNTDITQYKSHLERYEDNPIDLILYYVFFNQFHKHIINNNKNENNLYKWIIQNQKPKICQVCGRKYNLLWMAFAAVKRFDEAIYSCCFRCEIVETPSREDIIEALPYFIDACGFVPDKNYSPNYLTFCRNITDYTRWPNIVRSYAKIGHPNYVIGIFGSWTEVLFQSGVIPEEQRRKSFGIICTAKDGHLCLSKQEQIIDDWLYENKIPHTKEPLYPPHELYNKFEKRRADWKTGDYYIEYFGLMGNSAYEEKSVEKLKLAAELNLKLIPIYPHDIGNLHVKLSQLISTDPYS